MAFSELGLTEEAFFSMPPSHTYMMQMHRVRNIERQWEQTREIVVMIHNMAGKFAKHPLSVNDYRKLSFDRVESFPEWTKEEAEEIIRKWPDIKKN